MRTTKIRSRLSLLFIALAAMIAVPAAIALADNVKNNVVSGGNDTFTEGSSTTVSYKIQNTSGDPGDTTGRNGQNCNPANGTTATVSIVTPAEVSATPASLTFNSCDVAQDVKFSSDTPGNYPIRVTVSDSGTNNTESASYNTGSATFTLYVLEDDTTAPDTTAPTLDFPDVNVEATGPNGAVATWGDLKAIDDTDGEISASCASASGLKSGDTFPLGPTQIICTATDEAGNEGTGHFNVIVNDSTAPVIASHDNVTAEATGSDGANVSYTSPGTTDAVDGNGTASCTPASGSKFALGDTTVNCSAEDTAGNAATDTTFKVTVQDTTKPELTLPEDIIAEATGPDGAAVTYTASAEDLVDGDVDVSCLPASGSTFDLGTTTVNCEATDEAGNKATGSFKVTVQDTTKPEVTAPADITNVEATGPNGAAVTYSGASATDLVDGSMTPSCSPLSGSTFALGTNTVTCSATDAAGNTGSDTFTITVADTTAPTLTVPADKTVEAASASGATVNFASQVTATDAVDSTPTISCSPASGTTFGLGTTQVSCTAKDDYNNTSAAKTFDVTVADTTAPTLNLPSDITKQAASNSQVAVNYTATATDAVDSTPTVTCNPASGSLFSAGTTQVNCSATDDAGNTSPTGSFKVIVNYKFDGFRQPVDNKDANGAYIYNVAKAGSAIPVKFSLFGNQGLNIFAKAADGSSYPKYTQVSCPGSTIPVDSIEELSSATKSGLTYDATADQYNYVWKTDSTMAGKCYKLEVKFVDGSSQLAYFKFTK